MTRASVCHVVLRALLAAGAAASGACHGQRPGEAPTPAVTGATPELPPAPALAPSNAADRGVSGAPPSAAAAAGSSTPSTTGSLAPAPSSASSSPSPGSPSSSPPPPARVGDDGVSTQRLFEDASRAPAATLKSKGAFADEPLSKGLRDAARNAAPGMEADGPLATGTLKERETLQTDITLEPDRCYAIVGYSKKVRDLDLYLWLSPGILSGHDTTDDGVPAIGGAKQPICPVSVAPVTYKLAIVAEQGAGDVVVQLYSKKK